MTRRPTTVQAVERIGDLIASLKTVQKVLPVFLEQARLELLELSGGLPETVCRHCGQGRARHGHSGDGCRFEGRGADHSTDPPTHYADPTGETVIHFRPLAEGDCRPAEDLERYRQVMEDATKLHGSARRLLNNAPAVTLAVVDGRRPSDGRSAEEHAQRRFVRALSGEPCIVGHDHDAEDRFGPGQLRRGLCDRHRKAFGRWVDEQTVLPIDPAERLVRWQAETFGTVAGREPAAVDVDGPYRKDLKVVA